LKAIILGAGQGKRLLPLTENLPKALLDVAGKSLAEWQIGELHKCGVTEILFVSGFNAAALSNALAACAPRYPGCTLRCINNPDYATSDNLVSCWVARAEMTEDFVLLNGDTLFRAPLFRQLLASPPGPVTLAIDHKAHYDDDDMKVCLDGRSLVKIGKTLPAADSHGESIGMILFRGDGPERFAAALEDALSHPRATRQWYLSVIGAMAPSGGVAVEAITGYDWCEVDYPLDLQRARHLAASWQEADGEALTSATAS
jgi:choline kinase